jgi:hypothetical protein
MEQEKRFICVYLCSSVEKICPNLFCTDFRLQIGVCDCVRQPAIDRFNFLTAYSAVAFNEYEYKLAQQSLSTKTFVDLKSSGKFSGEKGWM